MIQFFDGIKQQLHNLKAKHKTIRTSNTSTPKITPNELLNYPEKVLTHQREKLNREMIQTLSTELDTIIRRRKEVQEGYVKR